MKSINEVAAEVILEVYNTSPVVPEDVFRAEGNMVAVRISKPFGGWPKLVALLKEVQEAPVVTRKAFPIEDLRIPDDTVRGFLVILWWMTIGGTLTEKSVSDKNGIRTVPYFKWESSRWEQFLAVELPRVLPRPRRGLAQVLDRELPAIAAAVATLSLRGQKLDLLETFLRQKSFVINDLRVICNIITRVGCDLPPAAAPAKKPAAKKAPAKKAAAKKAPAKKAAAKKG